jgi:HEPN domain-containing protein
MSQNQATSSSEEWLQIARKDFKRAKKNLDDCDVEVAGFFLQQSLEKYLKAFLLQRGWQLKKIHTLHVLLDEAVKYQP